MERPGIEFCPLQLKSALKHSQGSGALNPETLQSAHAGRLEIKDADRSLTEDLVISHAYPRPQLERAAWTSLNGKWAFAFDRDAAWGQPDEVVFDRIITVPFAPETPASGIADTGFYRAVWYRREFDGKIAAPGKRLLLHFGAVDFRATVWIN